MGTLSFWQRRNAAPAETADVAVVGGGIVGVSTAFWLHRLRPDLRVAIVEAGALASGASGRNAGFLLQGSASDFTSDTRRYGADAALYLWRFSGENRALVEQELDGARFDLARTGSLTAAGSPAEAERLQGSVDALSAAGEAVSFVDAARLHDRIGGAGFFGAMHVPAGGTVDSYRLVHAIAAASEAHVLPHRRVVAVQPAGDRVRLETMAGDIEASQAIFALNAYGPQLFPWMGAFVRPLRAQMLATAPTGRVWLQQPVYSHDGFYYIRQMPDGRLLVGGARHLFVKEEVGYEETTTPALQQALLAYVATHFPAAGPVSVDRSWSGVMGFSPDGLPAIGPLPGMPGSFWVGGMSGHGMGYGFRLGRLVAERALGRTSDAADHLFDAERFAPAGGP